MKTILILLLATVAANAGPKGEDFITTRTIKTGSPATIEIIVLRHPVHNSELVFVDGKGRPPSKRVVVSGKGYQKITARANVGWSAKLVFQGRVVDHESNSSKTGLSSRKGL